MIDSVSSSTDSDSEQAMNEALANVERSLAVLDKVIEKRVESILINIGKIETGGSRRITPTARIFGTGIAAIIRYISAPSTPGRRMPASSSSTANRFPASNSLQLSDLSALLQRLSGRNL